jgi:hypothetical protein
MLALDEPAMIADDVGAITRQVQVCRLHRHLQQS